MDKNQIFITSGTEYKRMTKELLEKADLQSHIGDRKKKIGIKPNLVSPSEASWGATTHPEVVAGIIEYLKEHGFRDMVMLEGSWVGDKTREAFETCGFDRLEEEYQVPFWDMQKDKGISVDCGGMELNVCERVKELDFLINVPVLKGHCQTKITCALKNMKGLIPNKEKRRFHSLGLHKPIAHLNMGIQQDFIVVDNICGDLDFEDGGNPVVMNRVMAACDPVLVDAYVCQMMHYEYPVLLCLLNVRLSRLFLTQKQAALDFMVLIARSVFVPGLVFWGGTLLRSRLHFPRPYEQPGFTPLVAKESRGHSMPSRHALSAAVLAAVWLYFYPAAGCVMVGIALLICCLRVLTGVHHVRDVVCGFALGFALGAAGMWLL